MAGLYVVALLLAPVRRFFELSQPSWGMIATAILASAAAIAALALCGYSVRGEPTPVRSPPTGPASP